MQRTAGHDERFRSAGDSHQQLWVHHHDHIPPTRTRDIHNRDDDHGEPIGPRRQGGGLSDPACRWQSAAAHAFGVRPGAVSEPPIPGSILEGVGPAGSQSNHLFVVSGARGHDQAEPNGQWTPGRRRTTRGGRIILREENSRRYSNPDDTTSGGLAGNGSR